MRLNSTILYKAYNTLNSCKICLRAQSYKIWFFCVIRAVWLLTCTIPLKELKNKKSEPVYRRGSRSWRLSYNGNLSKKEIFRLFFTMTSIASLLVYLNLSLRYKNNSSPSSFTVYSILLLLWERILYRSQFMFMVYGL